MSKKNPNAGLRPSDRKQIFGLGKQLRLGIDGLRDIAQDISGMPSISKLTKEQSNELIRRLGQQIKSAVRHRGHDKDKNKRGNYVDYDKEIEKRFKPAPPWCITGGQRGKINELMNELDWYMPSLYSWMKKQNFGFDCPGNAAQASCVISRLIAVRRADLNRAG